MASATTLLAAAMLALLPVQTHAVPHASSGTKPHLVMVLADDLGTTAS